MTARHSEGQLGRNIRPISKYPVLYAGRNTHVAQVVTRGMDQEEAEANADRLVKVWNCHDSLVTALAELSELAHGAISPSSMPDDLRCSIERGKRLLATIEAQP